MQKVNSQQSRLNALVGLLGNTANGYQSAAQSGYGAQAGIDNGIASIYGNLNSAANTVAAQGNATNAYNWGNLGTALGALAPATKKKVPPKTNTYWTGVGDITNAPDYSGQV